MITVLTIYSFAEKFQIMNCIKITMALFLSGSVVVTVLQFGVFICHINIRCRKLFEIFKQNFLLNDEKDATVKNKMLAKFVSLYDKLVDSNLLICHCYEVPVNIYRLNEKICEGSSIFRFSDSTGVCLRLLRQYSNAFYDFHIIWTTSNRDVSSMFDLDCILHSTDRPDYVPGKLYQKRGTNQAKFR